MRVLFLSDNNPKNHVIATNISSIEEIYIRSTIDVLKNKETTIQGKSFNHIRNNHLKSVGSIYKKENKHR